MFLDDLIAQAQSQARAFADFFCSKKRLKNVGSRLDGYALARIRDVDNDVRVRVPCSDGYYPTSRHCVDRVVAHVDNDFLQLVFIRTEGEIIRIEVPADPNVVNFRLGFDKG
jgi:hypothetical protein